MLAPANGPVCTHAKQRCTSTLVRPKQQQLQQSFTKSSSKEKDAELLSTLSQQAWNCNVIQQFAMTPSYHFHKKTWQDMAKAHNATWWKPYLQQLLRESQMQWQQRKLLLALLRLHSLACFGLLCQTFCPFHNLRLPAKSQQSCTCLHSKHADTRMRTTSCGHAGA